MTFLHGVEIVQIETGVRPIQAVRASVIALVGTAPKGPVNTPVLITGSRAEAISVFGEGIGTIPDALDGIFDQAGAVVVVINVLDPAVHKSPLVTNGQTFSSANLINIGYKYIRNVVVKSANNVTTYVNNTDYTYDSDTGVITRLTTGAIASGGSVNITCDIPYEGLVTNSNIIGSVDSATGKYTGIQALLSAESIVGVQPKILIAPSFSGSVTKSGSTITGAPVTAAMISVADRLRAVIVADGPNENDANAIAYRNLFGSKRVYVVDPWCKVWDTTLDAEAIESSSARVAGVMARNDSERGYYTSPSNQEINGIIGTTRAIDFTLGDPNARANLLNENEVATIIQKDGYRLWGNRTCSNDAKWAFLSHVRLDDIIMESILRAHMWAVDRNITKTYADDVSNGVNAFLAQLQGEGAISGGRCWYDTDLNTATTMELGQVYFNVDYGRYGVAERVTFRAAINSDYTIERLAA